MATEDAIEYDLEKLATLNTEGLLIQLIAREDLNRPNREQQLDAKAFARKSVITAVEFVAELEALGIPALAEALKKATDEYAEEAGVTE